MLMVSFVGVRMGMQHSIQIVCLLCVVSLFVEREGAQDRDVEVWAPCLLMYHTCCVYHFMLNCLERCCSVIPLGGLLGVQTP
jgi:hypothetical protein